MTSPTGLTMSTGEELFSLFLTEYRALDIGNRYALIRALDAGQSWDDLPSDVQEAFESWAELFTGGDDGP